MKDKLYFNGMIKKIKQVIFVFFVLFVATNTFANDYTFTQRHTAEPAQSHEGIALSEGIIGQELEILFDEDSYSLYNSKTFLRFGFEGLPTNPDMAFQATVDLTITPYLMDLSLGTPFTKTLKIYYNPATDIGVVNDLDVYELLDSRGAKITIDNLVFIGDTTTSINPGNVYLELDYSTDRYCEISATPLIVQPIALLNDGKDIQFKFERLECPEEYELEWTWVDRYSETGVLFESSEIDFSSKDFELNNTRIKLDNPSDNDIEWITYTIPNVYDSGFIIFRARSIGRFASDITVNYYGKWSDGISGEERVSDWNTTKAVTHHEANKNWQFQSSFAENGKKKEVVSYFDGTLRNRQTVTKINTDNKAIVGEVVYDNQGRPAIEILPVPSDDNKIMYYKDFNQNTDGISYNHNNFDWDPADESCGSLTDLMNSTVSGAAHYYSPDASDPTQPLWQNFVPNAKGYPFSQIEYTPDNTGRVSRKGGVGENYQLGNMANLKHEMQYFYLTPYQEELNRLFGYEVGNNKHYKKNLVVDPNGQVSVSYIDPQGRTIATALAGNAPRLEDDSDMRLFPLDDETNTSIHNTFKVDILGKLNPDDVDIEADNNFRYSEGINDGLRTTKIVGVANNGAEYGYEYSFDPVVFFPEGCSGEYPVKYDLKLSLKDVCLTEKFTNNEFVGIESYLDFEESLSLAVGSYALSKELSVNKDKLQVYANQYLLSLRDSTSVCYIDPSAFGGIADYSTCAITCVECAFNFVSLYNPDAVGPEVTQDEIDIARSNYVDAHTLYEPVVDIDLDGYTDEFDIIGIENWDDIDPGIQAIYIATFEEEFNALFDACMAPCEGWVNFTTCQIDHGALLTDMTKGGQYATDELIHVDTTGDDVLDSWIVEDPSSIFNEDNSLIYFDDTHTLTDINWHSANYLDILGQPYKIFVEVADPDDPATWNPQGIDGATLYFGPTGESWIKPEELRNISDFLDRWQPIWAEALIKFHPEYTYAEYKESLCSYILEGTTNEDLDLSSDSYDSLLSNIDTYDDALNYGLFGEADDIMMNDPYFSTAIVLAGETPALREDRIAVMEKSITFQYENSETDGGDSLTMLEMAYITEVCNGITECAPPTDIFSDLADLTVSQQDDVWSTYKAYYLDLKAKIQYVFISIYADQQGYLNTCIGTDTETPPYDVSTEPDATYLDVISNYDISSIQSYVSGMSTPSITFCHKANDLTDNFYAQKEKRFVPVDSAYNSGADGEEAINELEGISDSEMLYQTGICPLSFDLEMFLNGFVTEYGESEEVDLPNFTHPYLSDHYITPDLFLAYTDGVVLGELSQFSIFSSNSDSSNLEIIFNDFSVGSPTLCGNLASIVLPIEYSWEYYNFEADTAGSGWKILGFSDLVYTTYTMDGAVPSFHFQIIAKIFNADGVDSGIREVVLNGETCLAIGECYVAGVGNENEVGEPITLVIPPNTDECCTPELLEHQFEQNLVEIINELISLGELTSTGYPLNNIAAYTTGYVRDNFQDTSNAAVWNGSSTGNLSIVLDTEIVFEITDANVFNQMSEVVAIDIDMSVLPYNVAVSYYDLAGNFHYQVDKNFDITVELVFVCNQTVVSCSDGIEADGELGVYYAEIELGIDIGEVVIECLPHSRPDRFQVYWNNDDIPIVDSDYIGSASWITELNTANNTTLERYDYNGTSFESSDPPVFETIFTSGSYPNLGNTDWQNISFTKNTAYPTTMTLRVTGPIGDTGWSVIFHCPSIEPVKISSQLVEELTEEELSKRSQESIANYSKLLTTDEDCDCIPNQVPPVSCNVAYNDFLDLLEINMTTYVSDRIDGFILPPHLRPGSDKFDETGAIVYDTDGTTIIGDGIDDGVQYFCGMNYGYLVASYEFYLELFEIDDVSDINYLSMVDFGNTYFNYGYHEIEVVIYAYYVYEQENATVPPLDRMYWNDFANNYLVEHENICPPRALNPSYFIQPISVDESDCYEFTTEITSTYAEDAYTNYLNSLVEQFKIDYIDAALENVVEHFNETHEDKEYQYTLYYYDQAGNLIKTIPPEGVQRLGDPPAPGDPALTQTELDALNAAINTDRANNNTGSDAVSLLPDHYFETKYRYNALNQLVWQYTPDGKETNFAYDKLGRIIASQNAKQKESSAVDNNFVCSYSKYDALGRIVEAGQLSTDTGDTANITEGKLTIEGDLINEGIDQIDTAILSESEFQEVSRTIYNEQADFAPITQNNLRNRVTAVLYFDVLPEDIAIYNNAIFYSYDIHGNVKKLATHIPALDILMQGVKMVEYEYDLISGNVNQVYYQKGERDQFIHKYQYDADNRIINAQTSADGVIWEKDASYHYYDHGPLAKTIIGDKEVQGLDYAYTLQGWLKGVNGEELTPEKDMGKDGFNTSTIARDAFGYSLNYFDGDYTAKNADITTHFSITNGPYDHSEFNLYNGNIKNMITALLGTDEIALPTANNLYRYDQLNRIKNMDSYFIGLGAGENIETNYSYDRNGNLKSLFRSANKVDGTMAEMDNFTYHYNTDASLEERNNRLYTVEDDDSLAGNFPEDIDNQLAELGVSIFDLSNPDSHNYVYDEIGQLIADKTEELTIEWTVSGKVARVIKPNKTISFSYDGLGNRVSKEVVYISGANDNVTTYFGRDAQGNTLCVYERKWNDAGLDELALKEQNIYGSSRLGLQDSHLAMSNYFECLLHLILTDPVVAGSTDTQTAAYTITASNTIHNDAIASYDAGESVSLVTGFTADYGSDFVAFIDGCEPEQEIFDGFVTQNYKREVGDKRYELSNHLGNVLSVISDRKLVKDISEQTYQTTFTESTTPWTASVNTQSISVDNHRLMVETGVHLNGANGYYDLEASRSYFISLVVDRNSFEPDLEFSIWKANSKLYGEYVLESGLITTMFTPAVTGTYRLNIRLRE